jgi:hypothetical protein
MTDSRRILNWVDSLIDLATWWTSSTPTLALPD